MFAASVITAVLGVIIMGAYIKSIQAANKMNSVNTKISLSIEGFHILVWVVVAALYREGKNGHDLWGWACSPLADNIQPNFQGIVNFDAVCKRGVCDILSFEYLHSCFLPLLHQTTQANLF